ncbi:cancer susceptibility protein, putative (macronuclear) [Tetrahymena thermophila SB210]|uniref:Cancer susceptibility protein, putative n=1 Tax=Tetrahymena thermophila (strain SB210) TaxID=312017 RepID=Q229W7_TETTS|nr:cancer susceptibility protein, putative [Tetrahymena thermophila SB210]EAR82087.2 cancer susceptibility protein, putative [Tetrahymena thermophila SB210]|eukprot:XP_001029750.2 cancer susceptibility protein, putative [Tetrahymena thermophila SB210]
MSENSRENRFDVQSPKIATNLQVVKDVKVTTQQQNQFRIKTSRSQSPQRTNENLEAIDINKENEQQQQQTQKKNKADQKQSKPQKSKNNQNEENDEKVTKVKTIKVDKKIANSKEKKKIQKNNENNVEQQLQSPQIKSEKDYESIVFNDSFKKRSESNTDLTFTNFQNQSQQAQNNELIQASKSKSKSNKKNKEYEEDTDDDIFNGGVQANKTKSIINFKRSTLKQNKSNKVLPSIQKMMNTTDGMSMEEKRVPSKTIITEGSKKKRPEDKLSKKKKELEKQLLLKKKKKDIERIQKQKEEERFRIEKQRRKEEEQYLSIEKDRLKKEEEKIVELNNFYHQRQISLFKKIRQKESWDYTIQCNRGKLRLHNKLELDSYRFQIETNLTLDKSESIEQYLLKLQLALDNYQDIENYLVRLNAEEKPQEEIDWYNKLLNAIKDILLMKLQDLHIKILQYSDQLQEEKKQEIIQQGLDFASLIKSTAFEERQKVEITQEYVELPKIKYMFWINPVGKGGLRIKPVEYINTKVSIEVPRPYIQSKVLMTGFWIDIDYCQAQYSHLLSLGGVFQFQLFELPILPKIYKKYILKFQKENKDDIVQLFYPDKTIDSRDPSIFKNFVPVKISFQVPKYIILAETLQIGLWDENLGWQTDQVQDIKFNEELRQISFSSNKFVPFSLVQSRCEDYPYRQWHIRSISPDKARIDLVTKRFAFKFLLSKNQIELIDVNQHFLLEKMKGVKLSPSHFLQELRKCGVNLMPQSNDAIISDLLIKDKDCLDNCLNDISKAVSGFYFKSTKQNKSIGVNQLLTFVRLNPDYEESFIENTEKDWILTTWYSNKVGFYKGKDKEKDQSYKYLRNTETRSNFYLAVKQLGPDADEISERMKEAQNFEFWNTVREFLHLTQVLGYTQ